MLAVKSLERLIEIEADLKAQYETKLTAKSDEITKLSNAQTELDATVAKQKAKIAEQLQKITELSASSEKTRTEQLNRELNNQAKNLQEEVAMQKKRIKSLQKDLAVERDELKGLKQFDVNKMKKNLDAGKKKLAEKTAANELLQKSYNKFKKDNEELKQQVKDLEAKVPAEEEVEKKEEAATA
jgi:chromosome segregation ATPase